jgi:hypothetical protein
VRDTTLIWPELCQTGPILIGDLPAGYDITRRKTCLHIHSEKFHFFNCRESESRDKRHPLLPSS